MRMSFSKIETRSLSSFLNDEILHFNYVSKIYAICLNSSEKICDTSTSIMDVDVHTPLITSQSVVPNLKSKRT